MAVLAFIPFTSSAALYHYVTESGVTATVEADSAAEALATAPNIASDSGVAVDQGLIDSGEVVASEVRGAGGVRVTDSTQAGVETYQYITVDGTVGVVTAPTPGAAIAEPTNIAHDSGVLNAETDAIPPSIEVNL